ncbi:zinc finger protein 518A [Pangasianodon hypophthalmus]|uniref:zinc finger protein 518A n=1 Tax=Pangasianodon hypophthalmus TaxID=310915 RepID=UPI00230786F5|nr:zinc finger protein 518A [Pangasianodon hypophthalmus]
MNMEVEQTNPSSHNEDQAGDNDRGNWRRRLRLRKSSALSHTVNSTTEEQTVDEELTKESSQNEQKDHQIVDNASSKLTFTCSDCKDGTRFSPDGLLKHFKSFHGGKGHPPPFPCDMCSFVGSDFTTMQQHYLKHKHSRLTSEMCSDKGLETPSQLTKHCQTHNNQYQCEKCKFSTKELTHFLHNSCPHNTVPAIDSSEMSGVKPMNGELNRNLLADAAGEPQKDELLKHMTTACHRGWSRKNWWKNRDVAPKKPKQTASDIKFLTPNSEIQWTSAKFLPFSAAGLLDENGELLHPTRTLEETKQFLERTVNCGRKWPATLKGEPDLSSLSCPGPFLSEPKMKRSVTSLPVLNSGNELSGLMEKNNISVPPDCTTKVVGFKMVDGKKHLVLKVIPSAKPEVSSDTGEEPARLNQEERNDIQLDPHIERPSDQMCSESGNITTADSTINGYDSTSTSHQPKKQGLGEEEEEEDQDTIGDASQVDNTENDCSNDLCAFSDSPDAPAQLTLSGIEEVFNVVSQTKNEKPASPEEMFNSNDTIDLNGENTDVPGEEHSVREADIQTLQTNMQEISDKPKHTENQERAARDYQEINSEPSTSQDDMSVEDMSSSISSDFGSMEEGINSQLITLMSEKDRSPDTYMKNVDKKSVEEATIIQLPLDYRNEQKMEKVLNSPTNQNGVAMIESNIIDPNVASPHKNTTDSLFISPSEHGSLFFQYSGDENTNNIDPRYAHVPPDQNCTMETVEEPYLPLLSLEDSCRNPDLYQTLEELPVTTVSHLLDDSEVTYRGITSQSEPGSMATQQVGMHSPKAIPVAAVTNDKATSQLPLMTEPTIGSRRQREPTTKDSQGRISKPKRRLVRNSQESKSSASIPYWEPPAPEIERTLRLFPVRSSQPVKVPRLNQPVVVLNHPDTDIPEVANIMRSVHRHKGAVQRVVLSQGTLKALSELNCDTFRNICADNLQSSLYRRVRPQGTVKERFILNLKLKRLGGNKFKVANLSSNATQLQSGFRCWFCGRHFKNQEVWVGHGQRHIMEATRDWNKLFNSEGQGNGSEQQSFY